MNKFFLILLLFCFSCSNKEDKFLVDYESFIKQGKKIDLIKNKNLNDKDIKIINKISIREFSFFKDWREKNQNPKNLIYPVKINILNKKNSLNQKIENFIVYHNKIITVNKQSEIKVYNKDFKKLISKKIYKKKIYKNYSLNFSLIIYKKNLYISDNLGNINCYSLDNLKLIWTKSFGVPFNSNIKIHKNNLFIINSNSKIFSINSSNGNLNWSYETPSQKINDKSSYRIAIFKNKIFFTNDSSNIYCLDLKDNTITWSLTFGNENFANMPIVSKSSPITVDQNGDLFISNNNGNTYAIDSQSGSIKWALPIYSNKRFIVSEKYLFNVFEDRFFIINKNKGKILFNKQIKLNNNTFDFEELFVSEKLIYLFDKGGSLISIENRDLNQIKIKKKYFKGFNEMIILKNNFYIRTNNQILQY